MIAYGSIEQQPDADVYRLFIVPSASGLWDTVAQALFLRLAEDLAELGATLLWIEFLSDVQAIELRRVLLIWDGLPSHRCQHMLEWVASQRDWLSIERLPGFAPDVNPIEQVWGNLKSTELANLCSDNIGDVANIADHGLERIGSDAALCVAFLRHCGLRL